MTWRSILLTIVWTVWLCTPLMAEKKGNSTPPGGPVHMGHKFYTQYCSSCHGPDGRGNGPAAPALRTAPADLTRIAQRRGGQFPEAEIATYIDGRTFVRAHGSRDMPVWGERFSGAVGGGSLGEEVVRGNLYILVEYLRSIQE